MPRGDGKTRRRYQRCRCLARLPISFDAGFAEVKSDAAFVVFDSASAASRTAAAVQVVLSSGQTASSGKT